MLWVYLKSKVKGPYSWLNVSTVYFMVCFSTCCVVVGSYLRRCANDRSGAISIWSRALELIALFSRWEKLTHVWAWSRQLQRATTRIWTTPSLRLLMPLSTGLPAFPHRHKPGSDPWAAPLCPCDTARPSAVQPYPLLSSWHSASMGVHVHAPQQCPADPNSECPIQAVAPAPPLSAGHLSCWLTRKWEQFILVYQYMYYLIILYRYISNL